ncbi:MAG: hypothetical protein AAF548_08400 [Actinomycetota bacterium]
MGELNRRSFLVGAAGLAGAGTLLAACSDDSGDDAAPTTTAAPTDSGTPITEGFLVPTAPDGFVGPSVIVAGVEQRIAYVVHDGTAIRRADAPATAEIGIFRNSVQVGGGVIDRRNTGPEAMPLFEMASYYPVYFTPEDTGLYTARYLDGGDEVGRDFMVIAPGETPVPQPGDLLPAVETATFDDAKGIVDLCTRAEDCPFHEIGLADALAAADKPIVLSIATPGFCQTEVCGPVIEVLMEVAADRDDLYTIHAEVYVDPQAAVEAGSFPGPTADVVNRYGLPFEPLLFAANPDGTIVRRLDATYDRTELQETIDLLTA